MAEQTTVIRAKGCSTPEVGNLVTAYCFKRATEDERRLVEAHLLECDCCWQEVQRLDAAVHVLETDRSLMQTLTPVEMASAVGISAKLDLPFGGHLRHAVTSGALYDLQGRTIENIEGRTHYQMTATQDGGIEIEADRLLEIIGETLDEFLAQAKAVLPDLSTAIASVGYSNFWHAMLGVDSAGNAITPLYNWSDTRSATDAKTLAEELGVEWIHQRAGVVPHASYYPAKILWLRRTNPALAANVARFVSIGEYFYSKVFGQFLCGVGMATGTGLFNPNKNDWDEEMLAAIKRPKCFTLVLRQALPDSIKRTCAFRGA